MLSKAKERLQRGMSVRADVAAVKSVCQQTPGRARTQSKPTSLAQAMLVGLKRALAAWEGSRHQLWIRGKTHSRGMSVLHANYALLGCFLRGICALFHHYCKPMQCQASGIVCECYFLRRGHRVIRGHSTMYPVQWRLSLTYL